MLELAFLANLLAQSRELVGHAPVEVDHVVECLGELALDSGPVERESHGAVALLEGDEGCQQEARIGL